MSKLSKVIPQTLREVIINEVAKNITIKLQKLGKQFVIVVKTDYPISGKTTIKRLSGTNRLSIATKTYIRMYNKYKVNSTMYKDTTGQLYAEQLQLLQNRRDWEKECDRLRNECKNMN